MMLTIIVYLSSAFYHFSLIGHSPPKIERTVARRLNTTIPRAEIIYVGRLVNLISEDRLVERLGEAHGTPTSNLALKKKLNNVNNEQKEYLTNSEKKCRIISLGRIPLSPQASKLIRRAQVYRSILR
jgi:hypothetical protein